MRIQRYNLAKTFNLNINSSVEVLGFPDETHPLIPKRNDGYVFQRDILRDTLMFLDHPCGDSFYICGPTGCGKTSGINQIANRLRWPTKSVTCHGRLQVLDLIGRMVLQESDSGQSVMKYVKGPLVEAMENGYLFILNEMDVLDPSEVSALNDILEGGSLTIAETGEVVKPHPDFRFIATANSNGAGDSTGSYQGVLQQNIAAMDRFFMVKVDYQPAEVEKEILLRAIPEMKELPELPEKMIQVANRIRNAFKGDGSSDDNHLTVTMSTRTLIRWATRTQAVIDQAPNALEYGLERALLFRAEPAQAKAILRFAKDVFGGMWRETEEEVNG